MKELMGQGPGVHWPEGKYVEAEAMAKRAQEVDPEEPAGDHRALEGERWSRRVKRDIENRDAKENGVIEAFQGVDACARHQP